MAITLDSLASDTNLVAGREGDKVRTRGRNVVVTWAIATGTSPTTGRQIEVWFSASMDGTNFDGSLTGADANVTPGAKVNMRLAGVIPTDSTSDKVYRGSAEVGAILGYIPKWVSVYVVHNTGVNLKSSGHSVTFRSI